MYKGRSVQMFQMTGCFLVIKAEIKGKVGKLGMMHPVLWNGTISKDTNPRRCYPETIR